MAGEYENLAFEMYEELEGRKRALLYNEEVAGDPWWIVMHTKVAVRPSPSKEGTPLVVLPRGSVLAARKVVTVGSEQWLCVRDDELPFLKKKQSLPSPPEAYMLLEADDIGTLVMPAPREFEWQRLQAWHPRHRGEAARQQMLRQPTIEDATEEDIVALLAQLSGVEGGAAVQDDGIPQAEASMFARIPSDGASSNSSATRPSQRNLPMHEFADGLVDVSVNVQAVRRSYDVIATDHAIAQRRANAEAKRHTDERERHARDAEEKALAARQM